MPMHGIYCIIAEQMYFSVFTAPPCRALDNEFRRKKGKNGRTSSLTKKSGFANGIPGDKIIKAALLLFGQFAELKTETSDLNHAERNGRLTQ